MCIGFLCKHNIGMKAPPSVCILFQHVCCQPINCTDNNQINKVIHINFPYKCKSLVQNSFLLRLVFLFNVHYSSSLQYFDFS